MQTRQRIEEDASAFFSKHRSISSDTGYRLQTALFALTGTCTLVLTLCCVELVRELETYALKVTIDCFLHGRIDTIYMEIVIARTENVTAGKCYGHGIILQERFTDASIDLSSCVEDCEARMASRLIVGLYVKKPAIRKLKTIVPLEKKVGLFAVFFDAEITAVSRAQTYVCGELWSPTTDLRGCYQIE